MSEVNKSNFISKKSLEKLTGYLAHCATIIKGGRMFCRRLSSVLTKNLCRIRIPQSAKQDLVWWGRFTNWFSGKAAIANELFPYTTVSDSSLMGFSVYLSF